MILLCAVHCRAQASAPGAAVAPASATGSEVGFRGGYGVPIGKASGVAGDQLRGLISGQVPLWLEAGYRVLPPLRVGGYFGYGFGFIGDAIEAQCSDGWTCSVHDLRLGLDAQYHFAPGHPDPWLGVGVGYEWLDFSVSGSGGGTDVQIRGFELLHLAGGLDVPLGPGFGLGPFAEVALAKYATASSRCRSELTCSNSFTRDIQPTSLHEWLFLGVRGTVLIN